MDHGLQVPPAGPEVAADLARGGMSPSGMPGRWHVVEDGPCGLSGVIGVGAFGRQRGCPRVALFCVLLVESCLRVKNLYLSLKFALLARTFPPSTCKFDGVDRAAGAPQDQFCGGAPVDK